MSVVEQKLREDPGGLYGRMDFATRDRYRHVVEEIAKSSALSESEVARKAIQLAHEGAAGNRRQGRRRRSGGPRRLLPDRQGALRDSSGRRRRGLPPPRSCAGSRGVSRCCSISARSRRSRGASPRPSRRWPVATESRDAVLVALAVLLLLATSQLGVGHGELDRDVARHAAPAAANGLFPGPSVAVAHAGGRPDDARPAPRASRAWSRRWRSGSSPTGTTTCTSAC